MDAAPSSDDGTQPGGQATLLGDARQKFDERDYAGATGIQLDRAVFPEFALSRAPRKSLSGDGQWQELIMGKVPNSINEYPYCFRSEIGKVCTVYASCTVLLGSNTSGCRPTGSMDKTESHTQAIQSSNPNDVQSNGPSSIDITDLQGASRQN